MEWSEAQHRLNLAPMDATHQAFIAHVNAASQAAGAALGPAFRALLEHTGQHFAQEDAWMVESGFPARDEHAGEHRRVLGDLRRFMERIDKGSSMMARAYLKEQVPGWFDLHARTMDAALAAHLKARGMA